LKGKHKERIIIELPNFYEFNLKTGDGSVMCLLYGVREGNNSEIKEIIATRNVDLFTFALECRGSKNKSPRLCLRRIQKQELQGDIFFPITVRAEFQNKELTSENFYNVLKTRLAILQEKLKGIKLKSKGYRKKFSLLASPFASIEKDMMTPEIEGVPPFQEETKHVLKHKKCHIF
jgi:hypothetical protein